jgi:DNA-binding transcriptional regulator YdaS (Cro superfamily)
MQNSKLKKFKIACAYAGISQSKFACRLGVSWTAVWLVIIRKRKSGRISLALDKFFKKYLPAELQADLDRE